MVFVLFWFVFEFINLNREGKCVTHPRNPYLTVDAIIEVDGKIVLIERKNEPFGWALPGGFVEYGESLEEAVVREVKEETGADFIDITQFHAYSEPNRDPRQHVVSVVFTGKANGELKAADDAKNLALVGPESLKKYDIMFDHMKIISDYMERARMIREIMTIKAG